MTSDQPYCWTMVADFAVPVSCVATLLELPTYPYYWRVRTRFPERFGQLCRVLVRGGRNSCIVQFEDGFKAVTSRNYMRKVKVQDVARDQAPDNSEADSARIEIPPSV